MAGAGARESASTNWSVWLAAKSTWCKTKYFPTQMVPNAARLAAETAYTVSQWAETTATNTVEMTRPSSAIPQNGAISPQKWLREVFFHTQYRLSA